MCDSCARLLFFDARTQAQLLFSFFSLYLSLFYDLTLTTMSSPAPTVSEETIQATAVVAFLAILAVPVYHKFIKPKFKPQDVDTKKDDDAGRGRRGRLSRLHLFSKN